ncbi:MAG TPA: hypothetical protein VFH56_07310 [Acidimicrobiales bacterium]|nr:hypothetical protein [Acidimicrobiales bacterium]
MSRDHEADHSDRAALLAEIQRLKAQARRDREEIDWRDEQIRVLKRVIHKLVYLDQEQP